MTAMTSQRALVTGASGFLGGHLVRALQKEGWDVHVLLRKSAADLPPGLSVHMHDGSTAGLNDIVAAARPDVVFHLASAVVGQHTSEQLDSLLQANIVFGTQLLEAMAHSRVRRLINTGSYWQHYEGDSYAPVNLYAASKQAFEALIEFYVQAEGLDVITLKLSDTYGPKDLRPKLLSLLRRAQQLQDSGAMTPLAMSSGAQRMDLVHADDVCAAYLQAAELLRARDERAPTGHRRYSVRSGQVITLRDLVAMFEQASGRRVAIQWGGRPYRKREVMEPYYPDAPLPGWSAQVSLSEGLNDLMDAGGEGPSRLESVIGPQDSARNLRQRF